MLKYFCDDYGERGIYLRGRCGNDDYSKLITVETDFDAKNCYLTKGELPRWRVADTTKGIIVDSPLEPSVEEKEVKKEKEYKKQLADKIVDLIDECSSWEELKTKTGELKQSLTAVIKKEKKYV